MLPRLAHLAQLSAFVAAVAVGGCQSSGGKAHAPDARQEIHNLLEQYTQALLKKDAATLDRIWADDLTFINLRGDLLNKQNRMDNIKSGATSFSAIRLSHERIRTYGPVAVATFRVALDAQYSGQEGSGEHRVTTVWARPKGTWQLVAVQMTRIAQ